MELFEIGYCRICGKGLIWMPWDDEVLRDANVCSEECLEKLQQEIEKLPEGGELEGKK